MAETLEKNPQGSLETALPQALLIAQVALREQKRFAQHLLIVLAAILLAVALLFSFLKESPQLTSSPTETILFARVDHLNQELTTLQRYLGKTLSEALKLKLATLEQRIRLGQTGLSDLELIESMKQDLKLLVQYRETLQQLGAMPVRTLEPAPFWQWAVMVWGGLVVVFLAVGSYWIRCWWRLRQLEMQLRRFR